MTEILPWLLPALPATGLIAAFCVLLLRRRELASSAATLAERQEAERIGSHTARLLHPHIELAQCIGCGACVDACPEDGVLAMVHGQAAVVHGARCVGHGACADACPVGAIALTLGDLSDRKDLPALDEELEAIGVPGLFVAGELSGFSLIRTAITQGSAVADAVARRARVGVPRREATPPDERGGAVAVMEAPADEDTSELLVIGAGPAGLSCLLRARELGIAAMGIEQEPMLGGTVAAYPRNKLVMTQPVVLPLHGKLPKSSYQKEELIEIWDGVAAQHELSIRLGTRFTGLRREGGRFVVATSAGEFRARHVCLALGRRGTPRKLGVPGEGLAKVHYALIDAQSWRGKRLLVVGGGDSAIEAALGLAAQPGNQVVLSYRKEAFFRLKSRNESAIRDAMARGTVRVLFRTQPSAIAEGHVVLDSDERPDEPIVLANDAVFVFAGGLPPFPLLEAAGVSFDPALRGAEAQPELDRGRGLLIALGTALLLALFVAVFAVVHREYYGLAPAARATHPRHALLEPIGPLGLSCALLAVGLFACNLTYLVRRSRHLGGWLPGSLRTWMSAHVLTGLCAFFSVLLHAAFAPRDTVGGHAFWAFVVVVVTGAIGRWLYAFMPRATNGKELELDELCGRIAAISGEWDRDGRGFGNEVRRRVEALVASDRERWHRGFFARITTILRSRRELEQCLAELRRMGIAEGVPLVEVRALLGLARRSHRMLVAYAHYEEVRAVLGSWRYLHRWLALLIVLLTILHVVTALRYAELDWSVLPFVGGEESAR